MELDYTESRELISKLMVKELDDNLWEMWLTLYPLMEMGQMKNISFDKYKQMFKGTGQYKKMTVEEIYADVDSILEEYKTPVKEGE